MLTRCARPTVGRRRWSAYTVLGFVGYAAANVLAVVLADAWALDLVERLVAMLVPPIAFIVTITIATAVKGREWIVFYQAAAAAVVATIATAAIADVRIARTLDVVVLGIGVFLVFGRLGCFHVACCHGRPARWGVAYGDAHVAVGFWARWRGRSLVPIQLVESSASAALVVIGVALADVPGRAAVVYGIGYAAVRFVLEHWRGDPVRPFALGASEAQWWSAFVALACAIVAPGAMTITIAGALVIALAVLVATRRRRELVLMPHVRELASACERVASDPGHAKQETRLGIAVTFHAMPDGRIDWVMSCSHPTWPRAAHVIARRLWERAEVIEGRTPGVVHVLASS